MKLHGIHHITAIASDPQRNLDFYTELLGLRLVKRTVNFDDPSAYHFYFGDHVGTPGTILTFFPWPGARRGSRGTGQVVATSFAINPAAIEYWRDRLKGWHVAAEEAPARFGETVIRFADPDGLLVELIGSERRNADIESVAEDSAVPVEYALGGFHCPTLELQRASLTEQLLNEVFGFELVSEEAGRRRFAVDVNQPNKQVDVVERSDGSFGHIAAGTVHHIAFRASTDQEQQEWREKLAGLGFNVTPIVDRQYFHSIYFREPGGILFEIATDAPGFATDESVEQLGQSLKLPPQYEEHRPEIERILPPISVEHHSAPATATQS
ncbi:MAG: ring-cleaving dioxygenase [Chthoniobacterales bacterium]